MSGRNSTAPEGDIETTRPRTDFRSIWGTLRIDDRALERPPGTTIVPELGGGDVALVDILADTQKQRVKLGRMLGEGGMGVVHVAVQPGLGREVAVKTLRRGAHDERATRLVLQEALVTGLLEHPNIVPIYTLERGEGGEPLIVMKRIEGVRWGECIRDPRRGPGYRGDALGWQLGILMQVCNAVHYAHSKGILHRDIKPDNVMIGRYGDVYLLDWGLAVSLHDDGTGRIPLARNAREVAGTPAYVAPEMAVGAADLLGPSTDVYLLGATLHEVLTGDAPHVGDSLYEVLHSAYRSDPFPYGPEVPRALAAICTKAMSLDGQARFASAEELRIALEDFLRHRQSLGLVDQAKQRLDELQLFAGSSPTSTSTALHVEDRFIECRFAFREALRIWPDNADAKHGYQELLRLMAVFHLDRENEKAAATLVEQLEVPDPHLRGRLTHLRARLARREAEFRELKRAEREQDLRLGSRTRSRSALVLGVAWLAINVAAGRLEAAGVVAATPVTFMAGAVLLAAVLGFVTVVYRQALLRNQANRRILYMLAAMTLVTLFNRAIAIRHGISYFVSYTWEQLVYALCTCAVALVSDRRILAASAMFLGGATIAAFLPRYTFEIGGVAAFGAMVVMSIVWRPGADDGAENEETVRLNRRARPGS
jgi:serine/threonine-protein kinase